MHTVPLCQNAGREPRPPLSRSRKERQINCKEREGEFSGRPIKRNARWASSSPPEIRPRSFPHPPKHHPSSCLHNSRGDFTACFPCSGWRDTRFHSADLLRASRGGRDLVGKTELDPLGGHRRGMRHATMVYRHVNIFPNIFLILP